MTQAWIKGAGGGTGAQSEILYRKSHQNIASTGRRSHELELRPFLWDLPSLGPALWAGPAALSFLTSQSL